MLSEIFLLNPRFSHKLSPRSVSKILKDNSNLLDTYLSETEKFYSLYKTDIKAQIEKMDCDSFEDIPDHFAPAFAIFQADFTDVLIKKVNAIKDDGFFNYVFFNLLLADHHGSARLRYFANPEFSKSRPSFNLDPDDSEVRVRASKEFATAVSRLSTIRNDKNFSGFVSRYLAFYKYMNNSNKIQSVTNQIKDMYAFFDNNKIGPDDKLPSYIFDNLNFLSDIVYRMSFIKEDSVIINDIINLIEKIITSGCEEIAEAQFILPTFRKVHSYWSNFKNPVSAVLCKSIIELVIKHNCHKTIESLAQYVNDTPSVFYNSKDYSDQVRELIRVCARNAVTEIQSSKYRTISTYINHRTKMEDIFGVSDRVDPVKIVLTGNEIQSILSDIIMNAMLDDTTVLTDDNILLDILIDYISFDSLQCRVNYLYPNHPNLHLFNSAISNTYSIKDAADFKNRIMTKWYNTKSGDKFDFVRKDMFTVKERTSFMFYRGVSNEDLDELINKATYNRGEIKYVIDHFINHPIKMEIETARNIFSSIELNNPKDYIEKSIKMFELNGIPSATINAILSTFCSTMVITYRFDDTLRNIEDGTIDSIYNYVDDITAQLCWELSCAILMQTDEKSSYYDKPYQKIVKLHRCIGKRIIMSDTIKEYITKQVEENLFPSIKTAINAKKADLNTMDNINYIEKLIEMEIMDPTNYNIMCVDALTK